MRSNIVSRICSIDDLVDRILNLYSMWRRKLENEVLNYLNHLEAVWRTYEKIVFSADSIPIRLILSTKIKEISGEVKEVVKYILHRGNFNSIVDSIYYKNYSDLKSLDTIRRLLLGYGTYRELIELLNSIDISKALEHSPTCLSMMILRTIPNSSTFSDLVELLKPHIYELDLAVQGGFEELLYSLEKGNVKTSGKGLVDGKHFLYTFSDYVFKESGYVVDTRVLEDISRRKRFIFYINVVHSLNDDILFPFLFSSKFPKTVASMILAKYSKVMLPKAYLGLRTSSVSSEEIREKLKGKVNLAILFSELNESFLNSLWDMYCDVHEHNMVNPVKINLIAIKLGWLSIVEGELSTNRIIIVNTDGTIEELSLKEPIGVDSCLVLYLDPACERSLHYRLSTCLKDLKILQINPYRAVARVESKLSTHELMKNYSKGVIMPEYVAVERGASTREIINSLREFLSKSEMIVVKPDHGTEGIGVKVFEVDPYHLNENSTVVQYIRSLKYYDDILIEKFRGNVRYKNKYLSLRVVISWNGRDFVIESGYAMVSDYPITSMRYSGRPISLQETIGNLYYTNSTGNTRIPLDKRELTDILERVCSRIGIGINHGLNEEDMLKFMGIDIVLEYHDGEITPILIDVNPRPSGLNYLYTIEGRANVFKNLLYYISSTLYNI